MRKGYENKRYVHDSPVLYDVFRICTANSLEEDYHMGSNMEGNWRLSRHAAAEKPIVAPSTHNFKPTFPLSEKIGVLIKDTIKADEVNP